ncbi:MAG: FHA domain-containing protein [Planctomycetota bacterium]|nr:MAG: FHA domain-containing protein [Planctomycetota bacterium]
MAYLRLKITRNLEKVFNLDDGITIGRAPTNQIQLLNAAVSRIHARVIKEGQKYRILDAGSRSGIKINKVKVEDKILENGDILQIGQMVLIYEEDDFLGEQEYINISQTPLTPAQIAELGKRDKVALVFNTSHEFVEQAVQIGESIVDRTSFDESAKMQLVMGFREAIGNAERHGNKYDFNKLIRVVYENSPDKLTLSVEDEGEGFDFETVLKKSQQGDAITAARERYQEGGIGGLGMRVMMKCMDQIMYFNGGTRLVIIKYKKN